MTTPEDRDIVLRVLRGDRNAFGALVDRYARQVFSLAYRMTGSREDAEDLVQEAFARAYIHLAGFDPRREFFTWLYTVALNVVRNHLKRKSPAAHQVRSGDDPAAAEAAPEQQVEKREQAWRIQAILKVLPLECREALVLRFFQDLSFREVAAVLGIREGAAKMRAYRALEVFRERMAE